MARFADTINALKKGAEKMTADAAVKNIEMWEKELKGVDGANPIVSDLGKLKKALQDEEPDTKEIKALMGKLASATKASAKQADGQQDRIEELAGALKENA